jgi:hypothetical protein
MKLATWTDDAARRLRIYRRKLQRLTNRLRDSGRPLTQDDVDQIAHVIMAYAGDPDTPEMLEAYRESLRTYAVIGRPGPHRIITCLRCVDAHRYLAKEV